MTVSGSSSSSVSAVVWTASRTVFFVCMLSAGDVCIVVLVVWTEAWTEAWTGVRLFPINYATLELRKLSQRME